MLGLGEQRQTICSNKEKGLVFFGYLCCKLLMKTEEKTLIMKLTDQNELTLLSKKNPNNILK